MWGQPIKMCISLTLYREPIKILIRLFIDPLSQHIEFFLSIICAVGYNNIKISYTMKRQTFNYSDEAVKTYDVSTCIWIYFTRIWLNKTVGFVFVIQSLWYKLFFYIIAATVVDRCAECVIIWIIFGYIL